MIKLGFKRWRRNFLGLSKSEKFVRGLQFIIVSGDVRVSIWSLTLIPRNPKGWALLILVVFGTIKVIFLESLPHAKR